MELTAKQMKALTSLLSAPTVAAAATAAGVSERALYSWLSDPAFSAALAEARRELLAQAVGRLAALSGAATEALERALACGKPNVEIRAAIAILDAAFRGLELNDLADRVAALEARAAAAANGNGRHSP